MSYKEDMIYNQLIVGLRNKDWRERALALGHVKMEKLIKFMEGLKWGNLRQKNWKI